LPVSFGESIAPLLGRFVLAWFYLTQAYRYAAGWNDTALLLSMKNLPASGIFLFIGLLGIVLGALSLLLGFRTRAGALTLFTITVAATVTMHDYWHISAPVAREADYDIFARNIAIAGGLLALIGMGGGPFVMDKPSHGGGQKPAGGGAKHH
jgi:putative oxidoreductase